MTTTNDKPEALLPSRPDQPMTITLHGYDLEADGHWYSPDVVSERDTEIQRLTAEMAEQCRIIGLSGEREMALRATIDEQLRTIQALMVGMPDDGTTPVIRRIAAMEQERDTLRARLEAAERQEPECEIIEYTDEHGRTEKGPIWRDGFCPSIGTKLYRPIPAPAAGVPDGWQLVPKVPTFRMAVAAGDLADREWCYCITQNDAQKLWASMLHAAPQPGEQKGGE